MDVFDLSFGYLSNIGKPLQMFSILIFILEVIGMWKIFDKAGEKGWKAIIPIYNLYILFKITYGAGVYFLLLLIPIADIVFWIIMDVKLAKAFGHGIGFTLGLIFLEPIFLLALAFNDDKYQSPKPIRVQLFGQKMY